MMKIFTILVSFLFCSILIAGPTANKMNEEVILHCDEGRFAIKVTESIYGQLHYYAWDTTVESDMPSLILHDGNHSTGRAADHYDFRKGTYRYSVLAYFEGRGGAIKLYVYKNNEVIFSETCKSSFSNY